MGGLSLACSILFTFWSGTAAIFVKTPIGFPLSFVGFMSLPYTFVFLPLILSVSFYKAFSSDDFWGSLKGHTRIYIILFTVGVGLWSSIWLSGLYIA